MSLTGAIISISAIAKIIVNSIVISVNFMFPHIKGNGWWQWYFVLNSLPLHVLALQVHFRYDYDTRGRIARPRFSRSLHRNSRWRTINIDLTFIARGLKVQMADQCSVFTECLQARRSPPDKYLSRARCTKESEEFFRSNKSPFFSSVILALWY